MINYIGTGNLNQINSVKKSLPTQPEQNTVTDGQFTSALNNAQSPTKAMNTAESTRADRIAAIKTQVAEGSYKPDMEKVSASLLQFLVKEN